MDYSVIKIGTPIELVCQCGIKRTIKLHKKLRKKLKNGEAWSCPKCASSSAISKKWNDPNYRQKQLDRLANSKDERIEISKKLWADEDRLGELSKKMKTKWQDPEYRAIKTTQSQELWNDEDYKIKQNLGMDGEARAKISRSSRDSWGDPKFVAKMKQIFNSPEYKARYLDVAYRRTMSEMNRTRWLNAEFRKKVMATFHSDEFRSKMLSINGSDERKARLKQLWKDAEFKNKMQLIFDSDEYKNKLSAASKKAWQDPEYRAKIKATRQNPAFRDKMIAISLELWQDPKYRDKMIAIFNSPEFKNKMQLIFDSDEYKNKLSAASKKAWQDPEYRAKMAIILSQHPRVSSLQTILYSILDDLGIKYYREYPDKTADPETIIGPWSFDCVIPREGKPTLLIECQGEYWHNLPKAVRNDKSKSTYITNNFPGQYELKQIWEHEFGNKDKIAELLKYWMGITQIELANFKFRDIEIRLCEAKEYKLLLSKYHYLANAGRGGVAYGAYLNGELIAVCVFSPVVRQNIEIPDFKQEEVRELSRLCIHPKYQKKNFASWFISRCIKLLDSKYKVVISYCDTTFNHDGAIYKAANFVQDKEVPPDYWYVTDDGWVMHKKSLYAQAVKMGMKEAEYASKIGCTKVWGNKKLRFKYIRER